MSIDKVWAIVEKVDVSHDGMSPPKTVIKRIFDFEPDARAAVFNPYLVEELELDTEKELRNLSLTLTEVQRYAIGCYNEQGIRNYLLDNK